MGAGSTATMTSRSAASCARAVSTRRLWRIRAEPSRSPARRPATTSPTSCSACHTPARISFGDDRRFLGASASRFVVDDWHIARAGDDQRRRPLGVPRVRFARDPAGWRTSTSPRTSAAVAAVTPDAPDRVAVTGRRFPPGAHQSRTVAAWSRASASHGARWRPPRCSYARATASTASRIVYLPIATWLSRQPPFSTVSSVESTTSRPLTLAERIRHHAAVPCQTPWRSTRAFAPAMRENWQLSVQRDLPWSLTRRRDLPRNSRTSPAAGVAAEYRAAGRRESLSGLSGRLRLRLVTRRPRHGRRCRCNCAVVFAMDSWRARSTRVAKATDDATALARRQRVGLVDRPGLARPRGRARTVGVRPAPSCLSAEVEYTTGVGAAGGGLLTA